MNKLLIVLVLMLGFSCKQVKNNENNSEITDVALDKTTAAKEVDLPIYDFDGLEPMLHFKDEKTYVINFWATWCAPCVKELPHFERIHSEQKDNNVEVILVSLDMPKMWTTHLVPFLKEKQLKSKVVILDDTKQNTWIPKVDADWSGAIPATLIYNAKKRIFFDEPFTYETLKKNLDEFVMEKG
ncbi:redoxin domain-containing protein [Spongiimicrobium sp. 3-5]|uniref:redoxin domain-containing protein n=1 Tax=Spongiimicrobium sp. 3-5 TaxID=3332596 RepID=UPI00397F593A